jgi:hypothetical protein
MQLIDLNPRHGSDQISVRGFLLGSDQFAPPLNSTLRDCKPSASGFFRGEREICDGEDRAAPMR